MLALTLCVCVCVCVCVLYQAMVDKSDKCEHVRAFAVAVSVLYDGFKSLDYRERVYSAISSTPYDYKERVYVAISSTPYSRVSHSYSPGGELLLHSHSSHAYTHLAVYSNRTTTLVHLVLALLSRTQASAGRLCLALAILLRLHAAPALTLSHHTATALPYMLGRHAFPTYTGGLECRASCSSTAPPQKLLP